jgi:hypothetical protein
MGVGERAVCLSGCMYMYEEGDGWIVPEMYLGLIV